MTTAALTRLDATSLLIAAIGVTGVSTLALDAASVILAVVVVLQLVASRTERRLTRRGLELAEHTLRAQHRPELTVHQSGSGAREVNLAGYGAMSKAIGEVIVAIDVGTSVRAGLVSIEAWNVGAGTARITRLRVTSGDTHANGGEPSYWEPSPAHWQAVIVPAGHSASVDLLMAPEAPSWFDAHVRTGTALWLEITYQDLGAVETHVRWFELQQRRHQPHGWFVSHVHRSQPPPFVSIPPVSHFAGEISLPPGIQRPVRSTTPTRDKLRLP